MKPSHRNSARSVPQANLEDRALGIGDPNSADLSAGKNRARWSRVDLSDGGATAVGGTREYDVPHDLAQTPTLVTLEDYERASGACTITARGIRQENWSHSHCHVEVTLLAGSLDGCTGKFLVRGR